LLSTIKPRNAAQLKTLRTDLYIMPKSARVSPCLPKGVLAVYLHRFGRKGRVFYVGVGTHDRPYDRRYRLPAWRRATEGREISVEVVKRFKVPPHVWLGYPLVAVGYESSDAQLETAYRDADALKRKLQRRHGLIIPDDARHPHGSITRYQRFRCRCAKCRAANARSHRDLRKRRAQSQVAERIQHGVRSSYVNHGCRCEACKTAARQYNAAGWRRRRRKH
jgi:hypothetical protein